MRETSFAGQLIDAMWSNAQGKPRQPRQGEVYTLWQTMRDMDAAQMELDLPLPEDEPRQRNLFE